LDHNKADTRFTRLKWRRAFGTWEQKAARWVELIRAGYDPNQPRVPAGNRDGGRWTGGGGSGASSGTDRSNLIGSKPRDFRNPNKPLVQLAQVDGTPPPRKPKNPKLKVPLKKVGKRSRGEPPGAPPKVSKRKPNTNQERNRTAKEVARWLDRARKSPLPGQIRVFIGILEGISWFNELKPYVQSYFDEPKSLGQLNKDAQTRRPAYERHHIVEQMPARQDGFGRDLVDAPENIVSVPTYKHHEISGHYQMKRKKYGDKSLREHLRGKTWEERRNEGLKVMEDFGVLGP